MREREEGGGERHWINLKELNPIEGSKVPGQKKKLFCDC